MPTFNIERNRELFGETSGIQYVCNSLHALFWVQIKQIFSWGKSDSDHILVEGDCLYKSLGSLDMLSANQLLEFVKMFSHNIPINIWRFFFKRCFRENANNATTTLCLLFVDGFTTAIISSGNCYYLFNSHSRD